MLEAIILGFGQGLTEFLPVSSSGHLVVVPYLVPGISTAPLAFGVAVHAGSLLAVLVHFWSDLRDLAVSALGRRTGTLSADEPATRRARRTIAALAVASLPAALVGLLLKSSFERIFDRPQFAAVFLIITGVLLWASEAIRRRRADVRGGAVDDVGRDEYTVTMSDALAIGCAQAFSILPGISRAGSTMAAGMVRGLSREGAARFSFLLSIPVILGAFVLSLPDLGGGALLAGMLAAALSGYAAIQFLLRFVSRNDLTPFAWYVTLLGAFTLVVSVVR